MMILPESCWACYTCKLTARVLVDTSCHYFDSIDFDNMNFHHSLDHFGNHFESSVDHFEKLIVENSVDFESRSESSADFENHWYFVVESSVESQTHSVVAGDSVRPSSAMVI